MTRYLIKLHHAGDIVEYIVVTFLIGLNLYYGIAYVYKINNKSYHLSLFILLMISSIAVIASTALMNAAIV